MIVFVTYSLFSSPSERTANELEIIHEELLHIKALSHLSTTVSFSHSGRSLSVSLTDTSDPLTLH